MDTMTSEGDATFALSMVARCRREGLELSTADALAYAEALGVLGPTGLGELYWAGRATLVRRPEDRDAYDVAFGDLLAATVGMGTPVAAVTTLEVVVDDDGEGGSADDQEVESRPDRHQVRFSAAEVLRDVDFAAMTDDELASVHRVMAAMLIRRDQRRSRRRRPHATGRGTLDVRRTARRALRTDGEVFERVGTRRRLTPRRLVLLLDVSGSMERYAHALLRFAHAAAAGAPRVEVFALGTRLSRLTVALRERDPDEALTAAAAEVVDWGGGTRLGETLRLFNDEWGVAGLARGATVVILSDGWDRGNPGLLDEQMARLARVAHRIVWVNPLKATEGYAPLAAGMVAALPHVDDFVSGHSLASIEELVAVIAG
jgi:uncharacterized protein with von Willebrand factor type A (vWA) domain